MARLSHAAGLQLDRLTLADVPHAAALSAAIGWNQDEEDWRRLVEVHPEGVVAARLDGQLVGTATLVRYSRVGEEGKSHGGVLDPDPAAGVPSKVVPSQLAWLGMVITHPEVRGRGIGGAVTDAALALWQGAGESVIGLDATEYGAPIYRRRGFEAVATIDRWSGRLRPAGSLPADRAADPEVVRVGAADIAGLADVVAYDRSIMGVDRSGLLRHLSGEPGAQLLAARRGETTVGYVALRSGRHRRHVGPLVAADPHVAGLLLDRAARLGGGSEVFLDAVRGAMEGVDLAAHGLGVVRTLQRMARPARPVFESSAVVAAFDFAWG